MRTEARRMLTRVSIAAGVAALLAALLLPSNAAALPGSPDTTLGGGELWWDGFYPPAALPTSGSGSGPTISSLLEFDGKLLVAGAFGFINGVAAPGLAVWDGAGYEAWPQGLPVSGFPTLMSAHQGRLLAARGRPESNPRLLDPRLPSALHQWTGAEWEPLGADLLSGNATVNDIVSVGDSLFVCGQRFDPFPFYGADPDTPFVLLWDGTGWSDLTPDTLYEFSPSIRALEWRDGDLWMGGRFRLAPDDTLGNIARWDDEHWSAPAGGTDGEVRDLAAYQGHLVAAGNFAQAGGAAVRNVATWSGETWSALGSADERLVPDYWVGHLVPFDGRLAVAGASFVPEMETFAPGAAIWDGARWNCPGNEQTCTAFNRKIEAVALYRGELVIGGSFSLPGPTLSPVESQPGRVLKWSGTDWAPLGERGPELVYSPSGIFPTDSGLLVAGTFRPAGQWTRITGLARWDGTVWTLLEDDMDGPIQVLMPFNGTWIVGGSFQHIGGIEANHIAAWDGSSWEPFGGGMDGAVYALVEYQGQLIAGGSFRSAGGISAYGIAAWDGVTWTPLGRGLLGSYSSATAMKAVGPALIVSGYFTFAGYRGVNSLAIWDGWDWLSIDQGLTVNWSRIRVNDIAVLNGRLYAAGPHFETAGGETAGALVAWDALNWQSLGLTDRSDVYKLGIYDGRLVVGGELLWPDAPDSVRHVALWDGTRWLGLGGDVRTVSMRWVGVTAIAEWQGSLYLGGTFDYAGNHPSAFIARWDGHAYPAAKAGGPSLGVAPMPAAGPVAIDWFAPEPGLAVLRVADVQGRHIALLYAEPQVGGAHTMTWDLMDERGRRVPAGVYFLRLDTEAGHASRKIVVLPR